MTDWFHVLPAALNAAALNSHSGEFSILTWEREHALRVVEVLKDANFRILGGDAWWNDAALNVVPTYENWHCEDSSPEICAQAAVKFIEHMSISPFVLVNIRDALDGSGTDEEIAAGTISFSFAVDSQ